VERNTALIEDARWPFIILYYGMPKTIMIMKAIGMSLLEVA